MSSDSVKKTHHNLHRCNSPYETFKEDSINFNNIIIPFSKFGKSKCTSYIYNGNEKLSFKKRHPKFQAVFLNEFPDNLKPIK